MDVVAGGSPPTPPPKRRGEPDKSNMIAFHDRNDPLIDDPDYADFVKTKVFSDLRKWTAERAK